MSLVFLGFGGSLCLEVQDGSEVSFCRFNEKQLVLYPDSGDECEVVKSEGEVGSAAPEFRWLLEEKTDDLDSACFKAPSSRSELDNLSKKKFADSTERKIQWAVKLFHQWRYASLGQSVVEPEIHGCNIDAIGVNKAQLSFSLCAFLNEIKCVDGQEYSAKSLYSIIIMIQFFFEKKGLMLKLIDGLEFQNVKFTLDNLMKSCTFDRVGVLQRANVISETDEESMWTGGTLGEDTPDKLRDTVMYLLGISCALRGGQEHRNLRCPPHDPQITVCVDSKGVKYLLYCEDACSKTNQGGLTGHRH